MALVSEGSNSGAGGNDVWGAGAAGGNYHYPTGPSMMAAPHQYNLSHIPDTMVRKTTLIRALVRQTPKRENRGQLLSLIWLGCQHLLVRSHVTRGLRALLFCFD